MMQSGVSSDDVSVAPTSEYSSGSAGYATPEDQETTNNALDKAMARYVLLTAVVISGLSAGITLLIVRILRRACRSITSPFKGQSVSAVDSAHGTQTMYLKKSATNERRANGWRYFRYVATVIIFNCVLRVFISIVASDFDKALTAIVIFPINLICFGGLAYFIGCLLGPNQYGDAPLVSASQDAPQVKCPAPTTRTQNPTCHR